VYWGKCTLRRTIWYGRSSRNRANPLRTPQPMANKITGATQADERLSVHIAHRHMQACLSGIAARLDEGEVQSASAVVPQCHGVMREAAWPASFRSSSAPMPRYSTLSNQRLRANSLSTMTFKLAAFATLTPQGRFLNPTWPIRWRPLRQRLLRTSVSATTGVV